MSGLERMRIFSSLFATELAEYGLQGGRTNSDYETIATQWRERNKSKNKVHEQAQEMGNNFLPVYNSNDGIGAVAGRGIRVAIKTRQSVQDDESSSEDDAEAEDKSKKRSKKAAG
ncbi:hypothetical protein DOTSEDRAFT_20676 [Dothistroma septosporum NZE10]|uniref:Uncharacterized protein n=1 Tax=Dothistroma septosporum (strain NZE10 / CBS 128990) TaxID=675120 RepID=N1Q3E8_DOTSN|nr:hypothetical protein DOTSEDRAFT_20676 [Dothistroma septosporum NZE10]